MHGTTPNVGLYQTDYVIKQTTKQAADRRQLDCCGNTWCSALLQHQHRIEKARNSQRQEIYGKRVAGDEGETSVEKGIGTIVVGRYGKDKQKLQ